MNSLSDYCKHHPYRKNLQAHCTLAAWFVIQCNKYPKFEEYCAQIAALDNTRIEAIALYSYKFLGIHNYPEINLNEENIEQISRFFFEQKINSN